MKKFTMAIGLMLVLVSGVFAQAGKTNLYKWIEKFHAVTGARSNDNSVKPGDGYIHITFTNNSFYYVDEKGNKKFDDIPYIGEQNNLFVYRRQGTSVGGSSMIYTYYFSKDYKRLDVILSSPSVPDFENQISLYVQADPNSKTALIATTNLTPLRQSSTAQNRPSAPAPSTTYTPPPVTSPSSPSGGGTVTRTQCRSCNGSGLCSSCRGNYMSTCTYCNGRGQKLYGYGTNQTYETCAVCKGSGKSYCAVCYNPGGLNHNPGKCSVCKGSGYIN